MKSVNLVIGSKKYPVIVGRGLNGLSKKLKEYRLSRIGVVTNKKIAGLHLKGLNSERERP
mgnify:CR=1 FL=1